MAKKVKTVSPEYKHQTSNIREIFGNMIDRSDSQADGELKRLKGINDSNLTTADKEMINVLTGQIETYRAMKNVLDCKYSTTKVLSLIDSTMQTVKNTICTITCNYIVGKARKSSDKKKELEINAGKLKAISEIKCFFEEAFSE